MTRLLVDTMLGTLAKWLRAAGFDTAYMPHARDDRLLQIAESEGRILLTRDRGLATRAPPGKSLHVPAADLDGQLRFVIEKLRLEMDAPLSRCLVCNAPLETLPKEKARGMVPEGVLEKQSEFWRCPRCDKAYWPGSHHSAMQAKLQAFFGRSSE
ncbi:MAG: Mut7-C RNAse domain-containing protein [Euryarchaeota archaeon]|nr:Mut7-C RNAse domain-containing protein [Euryarchaeota archaeon]